MVFAFGIDVPLVEFLIILSVMNLVNLAVILYITLKLREEIRALRGVPKQQIS